MALLCFLLKSYRECLKCWLSRCQTSSFNNSILGLYFSPSDVSAERLVPICTHSHIYTFSYSPLQSSVCTAFTSMSSFLCRLRNAFAFRNVSCCKLIKLPHWRGLGRTWVVRISSYNGGLLLSYKGLLSSVKHLHCLKYGFEVLLGCNCPWRKQKATVSSAFLLSIGWVLQREQISFLGIIFPSSGLKSLVISIQGHLFLHI